MKYTNHIVHLHALIWCIACIVQKDWEVHFSDLNKFAVEDRSLRDPHIWIVARSFCEQPADVSWRHSHWHRCLPTSSCITSITTDTSLPQQFNRERFETMKTIPFWPILLLGNCTNFFLGVEEAGLAFMFSCNFKVPTNLSISCSSWRWCGHNFCRTVCVRRCMKRLHLAKIG